MSLFVDTSALYAILVASEEAHVAVADAYRTALQRRRALLTSNYVLVETAALLQRRFGRASVADLDQRIAPTMRVEWIDEATHRRAVAMLLPGSPAPEPGRLHELSGDGGRGLRDALALDADFAEQGFRLLPGRASAPFERAKS